jgi:hypothetical protein
VPVQVKDGGWSTEKSGYKPGMLLSEFKTRHAIILPGTKIMELDVLKKKLQPLFKEHKIEKAILFN